MKGPITFDRVVRWCVVAAIVIAVMLILNYLHAVLLPFFIAWLFAYLMYPLVRFIQYRMKVRVRALSIVLAMLVVVGVITGVVWLIIPPLLEQCGRFTTLATRYLHHVTHIHDFPEAVSWWLNENSAEIEKFLKSDNFTSALRDTMPKVFDVVGQTMNIILSVVASFITLLYMFFILMDYENLSTSWVKILPASVRSFSQELMKDVEIALNNYIRGQGLVALTMGVLFCIGFSIIGLPMAIGLGILIGILDMVPYLHTFALIPAAFLAAMKCADTGDNYWVMLAMVVAVFCIVQLIIEAFVIPKIMGKKMGLNPAVLLLSLSVWGALLGFIGLIVALPATTIIIAYWKKYVTNA
ncbi:MAG: AI-2E family transporter [Prevotella sp.]|nr:AI-2E family transporter [Candidatus Prevotella equi]